MSRNLNLSIGLAVAGMLLFASSLYRANAATTAAPDWQLNDLNGQTVKLSDFKGNVVILDFWATWCAPCRAVMPGFIELQKKYAAQGLTVIGVTLESEGASEVNSFTEKIGVNYPIVIGNEKVSADYGGITAIPTTFVLDRNLNIITSHTGAVSPQVLQSEILPLLEQK